MNKLIVIILSLFVSSVALQAQTLKSILGGLKSATGTDTTTTTSAAQSGLGSILGGLLGTSNFDAKDLVGTWKYTGPAVTLDSDNALKKIGGAAATAAIEKKIEPYYKRAGVTNLVFTVDEELNFTMKMGLGVAKGTIEKDENGQLIFNFKAFKKVNLGKVKANAIKTGSSLSLTFDVSRLKQVVDKVSSLAGNTTIKSLSSILSSYDGIYMGFKLNQTSN